MPEYNTYICQYNLSVIMADAVAILVFGIQYSFVTLAIALCGGRTFRLGIALLVFPLFAGIAVAVWHRVKKSVAAWALFALDSVVLGVAFFAVDWFQAYSHGQSNPLNMSGLLGLPLTIAVCPLGTMVCVAGCARALYLRKSAAHR